MGAKSKIEWTDATWNPVRATEAVPVHSGRPGWHCEHVSEGCRNCYAETMNRRLGTGLDFKPGHRAIVDIALDAKMLLLPLRWTKPRMIFVGSMTDLFADFVTDEMLDRIFAVIALTPHHIFQLLTKRPERMRAYLSGDDRAAEIGNALGNMLDGDWVWTEGKRHRDRIEALINRAFEMPISEDEDNPLLLAGADDMGYLPELLPIPNVWLGTSVEDQAAADARIPHLLATPAAKRFLSCEPLLGPVDLNRVQAPRYVPEDHDLDWKFTALDTGSYYEFEDSLGMWESGDGPERDTRIDWVIVGGESGANARPMHPDWARSLRDQCASAGVPFHFKQWGEWGDDSGTVDDEIVARAAKHDFGDIQYVYRFGKKIAGRHLDGVIHDGMPS